MKRNATLFTAGAWFGAVILAVPATADARHRAGEIRVETAVVTAIDRSTMQYEIGTLYVPENRAKLKSRLIGVGFVRVKASRPTGAPPIFLLAGGPGTTMLDIVLDKDEPARRRIKVWQAYADVADLVVIEQRGYTLRGDLMELASKPLPLGRPMTTADDVEVVRDLARRAKGAYPQADLSGYSIREIADDVDDLRRALGYPKISLIEQFPRDVNHRGLPKRAEV